MEYASIGIYIAVCLGVFAFVWVLMAYEMRVTRLQERLLGFRDRLDRNDARLWKAVFGTRRTLACGAAEDGDPVPLSEKEILAAELQRAFDAGTLSFDRARRVQVLAVDVADGPCTDWFVRRFALRDAAGHRYSLIARFLCSDSAREPDGSFSSPQLREAPDSPLLVTLDGLERAGDEERGIRLRLAGMGEGSTDVPWDTGISR